MIGKKEAKKLLELSDKALARIGNRYGYEPKILVVDKSGSRQVDPEKTSLGEGFGENDEGGCQGGPLNNQRRDISGQVRPRSEGRGTNWRGDLPRRCHEAGQPNVIRQNRQHAVVRPSGKPGGLHGVL